MHTNINPEKTPIPMIKDTWQRSLPERAFCAIASKILDGLVPVFQAAKKASEALSRLKKRLFTDTSVSTEKQSPLTTAATVVTAATQPTLPKPIEPEKDQVEDLWITTEVKSNYESFGKRF